MSTQKTTRMYYKGVALVSFKYDGVSVSPGEEIVMTLAAKLKLVDKQHKVEVVPLYKD